MNQLESLYNGKPREISANNNPEYDCLREAILNDLNHPRKYLIDRDGAVLIVTDIGAVARISKHISQPGLFIIDYVERELPYRYQFWVNKGTLSLVGHTLRTNRELRVASWVNFTEGVA